MLRLAVLLFIVVGCSKKETAPPPPPPPPPATADAAPANPSDGSLTDVPDGGADQGSAGSAGSAAAGSGAAESGSSAAASDFEFEKLEHDDKVKFMKQKVMPAMKPLFQKFDAKAFAKFNCKTCHGKNPQKSKYEMPTPDLPKLDFEAIKAGKEDPKVVEFMSKVVKPEMAKLLNLPEMTETNQKGFGCLHCHEMKKK